MTDLKDLCEKVLRYAESATERPWDTEGGMDLYVFNEDRSVMIAEARGTGAGLSIEEQASNAKFIAIAANSAERLAKSVVALSEAIEDICNECEGDRNRQYQFTGSQIDRALESKIDLATQALKKANEIARGEG